MEQRRAVRRNERPAAAGAPCFRVDGPRSSRRRDERAPAPVPSLGQCAGRPRSPTAARGKPSHERDIFSSRSLSSCARNCSSWASSRLSSSSSTRCVGRRLSGDDPSSISDANSPASYQQPVGGASASLARATSCSEAPSGRMPAAEGGERACSRSLTSAARPFARRRTVEGPGRERADAEKRVSVRSWALAATASRPRDTRGVTKYTASRRWTASRRRVRQSRPLATNSVSISSSRPGSSPGKSLACGGHRRGRRPQTHDLSGSTVVALDTPQGGSTLGDAIEWCAGVRPRRRRRRRRGVARSPAWRREAWRAPSSCPARCGRRYRHAPPGRQQPGDASHAATRVASICGGEPPVPASRPRERSPVQTPRSRRDFMSALDPLTTARRGSFQGRGGRRRRHVFVASAAALVRCARESETPRKRIEPLQSSCAVGGSDGLLSEMSPARVA